jgi:hypothetical protein
MAVLTDSIRGMAGSAKATSTVGGWYISPTMPLCYRLFTAFALICLPANAAVLTFSCDGTMKEEAQRKAHAITKMGLIVNSDAGVVTGFTGITAHIDEVNAKSVLFNGTTTHPSGAEWSVRGAMDLTTGSVGATVTWFSPKTERLLMWMNYELTCKPTN